MSKFLKIDSFATPENATSVAIQLSEKNPQHIYHVVQDSEYIVYQELPYPQAIILKTFMDGKQILQIK